MAECEHEWRVEQSVSFRTPEHNYDYIACARCGKSLETKEVPAVLNGLQQQLAGVAHLRAQDILARADAEAACACVEAASVLFRQSFCAPDTVPECCAGCPPDRRGPCDALDRALSLVHPGADWLADARAVTGAVAWFVREDDPARATQDWPDPEAFLNTFREIAVAALARAMARGWDKPADGK